MLTATIIGSAPNGLSAAIVLAAAGLGTTVFERNVQIGGACSTAETTLPNFRQDLGSSVYPLGVASPFFRSLPIKIPWIEPTAPCAHPLDDGTSVMLEHSIEAPASAAVGLSLLAAVTRVVGLFCVVALKLSLMPSPVIWKILAVGLKPGRRLERFRYGAGAFKIDYALSAPIPWAARECSRATTVHLGGSLAEIVESERTFTSDRPFVLLGQPSLFDPTRA